MNRLAELKGADDPDADVEKATPNEEASDNESPQYMTDFFDGACQVGQIKSWMSNFRQNISAIEDSYGKYVTSVTNEQTKEASDKLDELIDDTNELTHKIRDGLKKIEADTAKSKDASSETRIRVNMHNTLTVKFLDLMTTYQEAQRTYKDKNTEKMRRQYKIVNPEMTNEEIEKAIESGARNVFAQELTKEKYTKEAEEALNYVQSKHKQIKKLEASIIELHQLFVDMAVLVEAQGELVNQIEKNVIDAEAYTRKGVAELKKANVYQRKSRKKMCILLVILVVIVLIVVSSIIGARFSMSTIQ